MIENFIDVYNRLRNHGAIGYVTPEQRHSGEAEAVLKALSERKKQARMRRLEINRNSKNQIQSRRQIEMRLEMSGSTSPHLLLLVFLLDNSETM